MQTLLDPSVPFSYPGANAAMQRLEDAIRLGGPYDGLLGFSQGATLALGLYRLRPRARYVAENAEKRCDKSDDLGIDGWTACPEACGMCDHYWYDNDNYMLLLLLLLLLALLLLLSLLLWWSWSSSSWSSWCCSWTSSS